MATLGPVGGIKADDRSRVLGSYGATALSHLDVVGLPEKWEHLGGNCTLRRRGKPGACPQFLTPDPNHRGASSGAEPGSGRHHVLDPGTDSS
jgi:hypothetical protein